VANSCNKEATVKETNTLRHGRIPQVSERQAMIEELGLIEGLARNLRDVLQGGDPPVDLVALLAEVCGIAEWLAGLVEHLAQQSDPTGLAETGHEQR
jgi:hypothetical protein